MKPVFDTLHNERCFANHMGLWCVEPKWFTQAVMAVKSGSAKAVIDESTERLLYMVDETGVAMMSISGPMMKGVSKYGGTSTILTRKALRQAANDPDVKGAVMQIDSPGGTAAGTSDLADDVRAFDGRKPIFAYAADLMASAALWSGVQARKVYANPTALIGSIGTVAIVEDSSGAAQMAGVKVHIISSGGIKGHGADGAPVSEEYLASVQAIVNDMNTHFLGGVKQGRKLPIEQVRSLATGDVWMAESAQARGLIDGVKSLDETVRELRAVIRENERATVSTGTPRRVAASLKVRLAEME